MPMRRYQHLSSYHVERNWASFAAVPLRLVLCRERAHPAKLAPFGQSSTIQTHGRAHCLHTQASEHLGSEGCMTARPQLQSCHAPACTRSDVAIPRWLQYATQSSQACRSAVCFRAVRLQPGLFALPTPVFQAAAIRWSIKRPESSTVARPTSDISRRGGFRVAKSRHCAVPGRAPKERRRAFGTH